MDFKDIPRLIPTPNPCNYDIRYLKDTLQDWKETYNLNLSPDFQRPHVWTEEQRSRYVEFVLKDGDKSLRIIRFNRPEWKVHCDTYQGEMVIVDGLQRLTSVLMFLDNEITAFGKLLKDFTGTLRPHHNLLFSVNNLETKKEVLEWYLQINAYGTPHSKDELDRVKLMLEVENNKER